MLRHHHIAIAAVSVVSLAGGVMLGAGRDEPHLVRAAGTVAAAPVEETSTTSTTAPAASEAGNTALDATLENHETRIARLEATTTTATAIQAAPTTTTTVPVADPTMTTTGGPAPAATTDPVAPTPVELVRFSATNPTGELSSPSFVFQKGTVKTLTWQIDHKDPTTGMLVCFNWPPPPGMDEALGTCSGIRPYLTGASGSIQLDPGIDEIAAGVSLHLVIPATHKFWSFTVTVSETSAS